MNKIRRNSKIEYSILKKPAQDEICRIGEERCEYLAQHGIIIKDVSPIIISKIAEINSKISYML